MAIDVQRTMDFGGVRRITNLPDAVSPQEPATKAQLDATVEGINWKKSVRAATQGNINLAAPGATVDGVTMVSGDRFLVQLQTTTSQNGIYIWNGASTAATRASDANIGAELVNAVVPISEGTIDGGKTKRQTSINITLETTAIVWGAFGSTTPVASTSVSGTVTIATLAEVNAGSDTVKSLTPDTFSKSNFASRKYKQTIGDASATLYTVTHNLNTFDVTVEVYRNSGNRDTVLVEVRRTSVNAVDIVFDTAPALNSYRVIIKD